MGSNLELVVNELLNEVSRVYKQHQNLTDELLSGLQFVFEGPIQGCLDLVDQRCVSRLVSPSGRSVYQVIGSSGTPYTCLMSSNYCGCPAFMFSVLKKGDHLMCKHMLAVRISVAMGVCPDQLISDEELANIIRNID